VARAASGRGGLRKVMATLICSALGQGVGISRSARAWEEG
jgi:hypothetical protein